MTLSPLPHVNAPTVSEYYEVIWLPARHRNAFFCVLILSTPPSEEQDGSPKFLSASLRTCHALRPRQSLSKTKSIAASSVGFRLLDTVTRCIYAVTRLNSFTDGATSTTAYALPGVRLDYFIRHFFPLP